MPSAVAEIGEVLETHMKKIGLIKDEELSTAHLELIAEKRAALEGVAVKDVAIKRAANAEKVDPGDFPPGARLCMKCHVTAMVLMDGCMTCLSCGDSKCG